MATLVNVYYDGLTFSNATGIFTDSSLTIYAAAGWYAESGIYRYWDGLGVLGPPTTCPVCPVRCDSTISGNGGQGIYKLEFDAGEDTGAVIIRFNPAAVPDRCTWTYDGVSASEYSSPTQGYLQGVIGVYTNPPIFQTGITACSPSTTACTVNRLTQVGFDFSTVVNLGSLAGQVAIDTTTGLLASVPLQAIAPGQNYIDIIDINGGAATLQTNGVDYAIATGAPTNDCFPCGVNPICNSNGSNGVTYSGTEFEYDNVFNTFISTGNTITMGPFTNNASGGTSLTANPPGSCMMVIPKPNAFPTGVDLEILGPCGGTAWSVELNCPTPLNIFPCKPHPMQCADPLPDFIYTAHVFNSTGVSMFISVNDWAFADVNGVNQKPAGIYGVDIAGVINCVTVDANGIVTAVTPCVGTC